MIVTEPPKHQGDPLRRNLIGTGQRGGMLKSWLLLPDLNMFLDFWGLGSQGFTLPTLHILSPTVPNTLCTQLVLKYLLLTAHFLTSGDFQMPASSITQQGQKLQSGTNCLGLLWVAILAKETPSRKSKWAEVCEQPPAQAWHVAGTDRKVSGFSSFPIHRAWPAESER